MTRVLLVHNFYGSGAPSGENEIFAAERALLERGGYEVDTYVRRSDEILRQGALGVLRGAAATPWNPFTTARVRSLLARTSPDVLHVHNTFPLVSPSVFHAARGLPVATVLTLHNYRAFCASALLFRDGRVCTECLDRRSVYPALRHGCYRGSRLATLPLAVGLALHRAIGTWTEHVDAFVALTPFQRDVVVRGGFPAERVHVKPNFHERPPTPVPFEDRLPRVLFVGRLAPEKGVGVLLEAWRRWGDAAPPLEVVGEGPERERLAATVAASGLAGRVSFAGRLSPDRVEERLLRSRLLVVPSLWYEGFPLVVREAFAAGVPVVASRLGALAAIVEEGRTGVTFAPGSAAELHRTLASLWARPERLREMGEAARAEFDARFTGARSLALLETIYDAAREARARKLRRA